MFEKSLTVKYVSSKTCFLHLPQTYKVNTGKCMKLTYSSSGKFAYFSVSVSNHFIEDYAVGIDSKYANALGIHEHDQVQVSEIADLPIITSLSIVTNSKEDYEVLELLTENVQNTLLEQVRVVNSNQKLNIWIGQNVWVIVTVENVQPVSPGMITALSEVIIKPANENVISNPIDYVEPQQDNGSQSHNFNTFLSSFLNSVQSMICSDEKQVQIPEILHTESFDKVLRMISLDSISHIKSIVNKLYPFNVFTSKENFVATFSESFNSSSTPIFGCLTPLEPSVISVKEVYVRVCFLEDFYSFKDIVTLLAENIFVSNVVINYLECNLGARVVLKPIQKQPLVNEIEIHCKKNYLEDIVEKLKLYLASNSLSPFVLNSDIAVAVEDNFTCSLKFLPDFPKYCIVDENFLRNVKYFHHNEFVTIKEQTIKTEECGEGILNISNFETIVEDAVNNFTSKQLENVLITGKPGTGKTTLVKNISRQLSKCPYFIYSETISCRKVKGKTMESLSKMFTITVSNLILCQPSVLILEDLHVLCENCQGEETPNSLYFNRISEMLHNFLKVICKCNSIGILATSESTTKLNKNIYRSRGSHLFKNHYSIAEFTKSDRKTLLKQMFKKHRHENIDFVDLSLKTEGFVVQDIVDFFNKVLFESYKDVAEHGKVAIQECHSERALKNTCALSLQNVQLQTGGMKSFDDIGGLRHVKDVLVESLLWPAQYPTIFGDSPLRLQSGLLLYGPPGTGKTLLAGAAARHCGLRLISIKGPELLSKYIGASEQAVRDVFEKAQSARPCILFFDEFDSLAPRRGHDNTGVTDRVVNQLLTQLDGVESLSGVCVLAATSRPDLLDPALLRPGRLDRQLLCALPNMKERLEVLQVLSKNLDMTADVRLEEVAEQTDGYSGADLQSVLYTAQLASVNYLFENEKDENIDSQITQSHLMEALNKTRPSLTRSERLKYDRIYTKFQGGTLEDFKTGSKSTLA